MPTGDSPEASGRRDEEYGVTSGRSDPSGPGGADETAGQIEAFLRGESPTVRLMAGWARSVATHRAWGFETPDDVVQSTLLALVQNFRDGRFKGGNLRAYVQRITMNMCITDYRRSRARGENVPLEDTTPAPATPWSGEDTERRVILDRILDRLGEKCRRIVVMAYIQGYSRKEVGEQLGITEEAARVKLFRCISKARDIIEEIGGVGAESG